MDQSLHLLNADIQFLDTRVVLIHIPLPLYVYFTQPILQLLNLIGYAEKGFKGVRRPWQFDWPFANISVTPIECSIVCPRHLAQELFVPLLASLNAESQDQISISHEEFVVIQVGGGGMEAGQRVLDLTAPLALAGISLFFITSYYSDFILVPSKSQSTVVHALEDRGFVFQQVPSTNGHSATDDTGPHMTAISSPTLSLSSHNRNASTSAFDALHSPLSAPGTPPPSSIAEWATRTFNTLSTHSISPKVDPTIRLATCAGHRADDITQDRLSSLLSRSLICSPPPRFLSITLTDTDSASITIDQDLLDSWPKKGEGVLLMSEEISVPIMLDLRELSEQKSTGIVCGVAGRLIERLGTGLSGSGNLSSTGSFVGGRAAFNMSYLSTAKAGNVIVGEDEVEEALEALKEIRMARPTGSNNTAKEEDDEEDEESIFRPSQPVNVGRH